MLLHVISPVGSWGSGSPGRQGARDILGLQKLAWPPLPSSSCPVTQPPEPFLGGSVFFPLNIRMRRASEGSISSLGQCLSWVRPNLNPVHSYLPCPAAQIPLQAVMFPAMGTCRFSAGVGLHWGPGLLGHLWVPLVTPLCCVFADEYGEVGVEGISSTLNPSPLSAARAENILLEAAFRISLLEPSGTFWDLLALHPFPLVGNC